ncbi:hypothetical protein [Thalassobellus suaedae]|uniref:Uncharacterized protein n=1 Tax=Thalassobellus suaedae TaxID=3074124 RepID=A0ABY9XVS1_9FLAO|nr:hypothetical protein RHP51_05000 [Flavobacteriaceae bacterium HL-DH14]
MKISVRDNTKGITSTYYLTHHTFKKSGLTNTNTTSWQLIQFSLDNYSLSKYPDFAIDEVWFEGINFPQLHLDKISIESGIDIVSNIKIPTNTSQLVNDGEDGVNPFITANEVVLLPAPNLKELVPDTYLPSTTGNFILRGSYFTEDMTIVIEGHTYNYWQFIDSGEVRVNLTTSAIEGTYDVTLNNGTEATFTDVLQIVNGTVYQPVESDWSSIVLLDTGIGFANLGTYLALNSAEWIVPFDWTKDFEVTWMYNRSPLGIPTDNSDERVGIHRLSSGLQIAAARFGFDAGLIKTHTYDGAILNQNTYTLADNATNRDIFFDINIYKFKYDSGTNTLFYYVNELLRFTFSNVAISEDMYLRFVTRCLNIINVKYIDLSDTGGETTDYYKLISQFINDSNYLKTDLSLLGAYADDTAAAADGVEIGFAYINSSTGALHRRLT